MTQSNPFDSLLWKGSAADATYLINALLNEKLVGFLNNEKLDRIDKHPGTIHLYLDGARQLARYSSKVEYQYPAPSEKFLVKYSCIQMTDINHQTFEQFINWLIPFSDLLIDE